MIAVEPADPVVLIGQLTDTHVVEVAPTGRRRRAVRRQQCPATSAVASLNAEAPALDVRDRHRRHDELGPTGEYETRRTARSR